MGVPREAEPALAGLREFGGDSLVRSLLKTFLSIGESHLQQAEQAAAAADQETLSRIAHTLKSSAAQVGLPRMSEACHRTERLIRDHGDLAAARLSLREMRRQFEEAQRWMRPLAVHTASAVK